jgi:tetratricopeptide (TPR) repeat protein
MSKPFQILRRFAGLLVLLLCSPIFRHARIQGQDVSTDVTALANAAAAARDQNHVEEAIRDYREALKLRPDWQEGLWSLGTLEYDRDHYAEAVPAFQRLTQLAPESGPGWTFLGLCEYETKDYAKALQDLAKGQRLGGTDDAEILRVAKYHLAMLMSRFGNFDGATAILRSLLAQGQTGTQIKTALGLAVLRVPLVPEEVDPSRDALLQEAGEAGALVAQGQTASGLSGFESVAQKNPEIPYIHLAYGEALFGARKYLEAVQQCRKEIALSPESAAAHELLGKSMEAAGEREKARDELATARKLPRQMGVEERVARLYENRGGPTITGETAAANKNGEGPRVSFEELSLEAESASAAGDVNLAVQRYHQALQIRPEWQDGLWRLAMLSYSTHRYAEAISALRRWVERTPNVGTAWAVMGLAEFEMKDYENACIHLERGQQLGLTGNLESVQLARYRLGTLLLRDGKFENAEGLLMSVAAGGPLAVEVRFALGMSLLRMAGWPEKVAAEKKPLVASMGEIGELLKDSKYDEAFPKFETLIGRYPSAPFVHYVYGTALETFSRYDEAERQFREEARLSPASALPYTQLAAIGLKRHDAHSALPLALQAVKLAPTAAEAHYELGRTYLEIGNERQAIRELEAANKIAPQSAQIHFNLAKAYAKANRPERAAEQRAIFARLNALAEEQRSVQGSQSYGAHNGAQYGVPGAAQPE